MRPPVIFLAICTGLSFLTSLITSSMANTAAEKVASSFGPASADEIQHAASLARFSDVCLVWTGVGVAALLIVWCIKRALDTQVLHINDGTRTRR